MHSPAYASHSPFSFNKNKYKEREYKFKGQYQAIQKKRTTNTQAYYNLLTQVKIN